MVLFEGSLLNMVTKHLVGSLVVVPQEICRILHKLLYQPLVCLGPGAFCLKVAGVEMALAIHGSRCHDITANR